MAAPDYSIYFRILDGISWIWTTVTEYADSARMGVNNACIGLEPWQVAAYTVGITCFVVWLQQIFRSDQPIKSRLLKWFFKHARNLPWIKQKIEQEMAKTRAQIEGIIHESDKGMSYVNRLPDRGLTGDEIIKEAHNYNNMGHIDWKAGRVSGGVYSPSDELYPILSQVFEMFITANPLHPDVFPGVRKMEAEIVRMCCDMFNGDVDSCGVVTSGGTESILLCCLAYRNRAYSLGITEPEMVIPVTAHAAFDKAGELFRIQVTHVPVDKKTLQVDVRKMKKAITSNTCMLVASAPGFPHGIMDPISEIAKLGERKRIPVHVDSCLGGFLIPFMAEAGYDLPMFDFRCEGVTSISCDTHKYGFTPKGSSVILYRSMDVLRNQYFCQPNWPGGIYATATLAGSRSGANIALTWAAMMYHGRNAYVDSAKKIISSARFIKEKLNEIDEIQVSGDPLISVVAFTSDVFNIYAFNDKMTKLGWNLNALQFPTGIHIAVTGRTALPGVKEQFVQDFRATVEEMKRNPGNPKDGSAAIYGMAQSIPDRGLVSEFAFMYLDACYSTTEAADKKGH